jgi:hypothetical protein
VRDVESATASVEILWEGAGWIGRGGRAPVNVWHLQRVS